MKNANSIVLLLLFVATGIFTDSCAPKLKPSKEQVIYPAPPDTARILYLTSFSNSLDITGKRSALKSDVIGEDKGIPVGKPYGLATTPGKLYICDAAIGGLLVVNLAKKSVTPFTPGGKGKLRLPINCCVDAEQKLYVADPERREVVVFDKSGDYSGSLSDPKVDSAFRPLDVVVSGDRIYVTNAPAARVYVYNRKDMSFITAFPEKSGGQARILYNPINITANESRIYVTDFGDFKVKIFSEEGGLIQSVGEYGKNLGQFVRPKGLSIDKNGILYVVDAGFENVQLFNEAGKLLMFFGGPYKAKGDMWLPAKVHIDYSNTQYYRKIVPAEYDIKYLIFVSNQYGPDKISVYAAIKPARK